MSSSGEAEHVGGDPAKAAQADDPTAKPLPDVVKAVVEGYYSRGLDAVDRARQRAEHGYTIASAIAAALVAAGLLTHLEERPTVVQVLALMGLSLWLLVALLFMIAVAIKVDVKEPNGYSGWDSFVTGIATQLRDELRVINKRLLRAVVATSLASAVTIAALCFGVADSGASAPVRSRVELTAQGDEAMTHLCGRQVGFIYATVEPDALSEPIVKLALPAGECGSTAAVARVRKDEIDATEEVPTFPSFPLG